MADSPPPSFTPVPVRRRRDGWTPERQLLFIARLIECRCPSHAARQVGLSRESAYRLRRHSGAASFAAAWDAVLAAPPEPCGPGAYERAFKGVLAPVVYRGCKVGERRVFDRRSVRAILAAYYRARDAEKAHRKAQAKKRKKMDFDPTL